jgi:hypothetical protein
MTRHCIVFSADDSDALPTIRGRRELPILNLAETAKRRIQPVGRRMMVF